MMAGFKHMIKRQRQVWHSLRLKPGFAATVVLTMGLTLGALLTVLSMSYQLLLAPLPYPDSQRLYQLDNEVLDPNGTLLAQGYAYPALVQLHRQQQAADSVLAAAAMLHFGEDVLTSHKAQPTLKLGYATPEWFDIVAPKMALGQAFGDEHKVNSHVPVAVISHQSWVKYFDANPGVVNQSLSFSGVSFRIIGVLGEDFVDPKLNDIGVQTQVWLPWDFNPSTWLRGNWSMLAPQIMMVAKLKDNGKSNTINSQVISAGLNRVWLNNNSVDGPMNGARGKIDLMPLAQVIKGDITMTLMLLLIGVIGLVSIATVNIANLMMSRTAEQQRVLAIRAAVGAAPGQLFTTILAETGQLMGLSMLLALPVAGLGFSLIGQYLSGIFPRADELGLGGLTLLLALLVGLVFALLFAYLSSRMINYRALNQTLQSSGKGTGVQVSAKVTVALIFSQVAIACALIFVNGVLFTDAVKQINTPMGFNVDNMQRLNLSYNAESWPEEPALIATMTELQQALEQLPQVEAVSRSSSPLRRFYPDQRADMQNQRVFNYQLKRVSHDYFDILQQKVLAGDVFSAQDRLSYSPVIVVNQVLARQMLAPGETLEKVLGKRLLAQGDDIVTVVAVVDGITKPGEREVPPRAYSPVSMGIGSALIKFKDNQSISREQMVSVLKKVDPMFSVGRFDSLTDLRDRQLFTQYVSALTTALLALLSLFVAAIGLYGILSYATQMRRVELGTRMAVGADKPALVKMVLFDQLKPVLSGMLLSCVVIMALYVEQKAQLQLYLQWSSAWIFVQTVVAILLITFFACYLPLRRYVNRPVIYALRQQ